MDLSRAFDQAMPTKIDRMKHYNFKIIELYPNGKDWIVDTDNWKNIDISYRSIKLPEGDYKYMEREDQYWVDPETGIVTFIYYDFNGKPMTVDCDMYEAVHDAILEQFGIETEM